LIQKSLSYEDTPPAIKKKWPYKKGASLKGMTFLVVFYYLSAPLPEGVPGVKKVTRFLCPRGTSPLKGVNPGV
jgi:hypothetical protein